MDSRGDLGRDLRGLSVLMIFIHSRVRLGNTYTYDAYLNTLR